MLLASTEKELWGKMSVPLLFLSVQSPWMIAKFLLSFFYFHFSIHMNDVYVSFCKDKERVGMCHVGKPARCL